MRLVPECHLQPWAPLRGLQSPNGFVDTEADAPIGRVYLAETDVAEAARLFGWLPPAEVLELQQENERLHDELVDAKGKLEQLLALAQAVQVASELLEEQAA